MTTTTVSHVRFSHALGRNTQAGGGFNNPVDVAAAPGGKLYVLSRSNMNHAARGFLRVTICTIDEEYIGQFTTFGEGDGQIVWPTAIAVDQDVNVYVSDEHRHDVQAFDRDGNFLHRWGSLGDGPGQFYHPAGLAVDAEGQVLVVDSVNNRVQTFSADGRFLQAWGTAGAGPGQFNLPWGITVDRANRVYVADWRNGRVQQFSVDGTYLTGFGDREGEGRLERPADVGVDSRGNVYVSDYGRDVVEVYEPDGRHLTTLLGEAVMTRWAAQYIAADPLIRGLREQYADDIAEDEPHFEGPRGLTVDEQDRIIITDCCKHRLQVYQLV
jgi:DNA-binding beta-propeller fold protein YncE